MRALVIYDGNGPLPVSANFDSPTDGGVVFVLTGTTRTDSAPDLTGIQLSLDGTAIGSAAMCWANQNDNHMAMRPTFTPYEGLTIGSHSIEITNYGNTITDVNDYFQVTMLY